MSELTYDALMDKKAKKIDRRRERELSDIRFLLKHPEFRRFYWRWMEEGGAFTLGYCGENTNATNYSLGRRSLGLEMFNDLIEAKPDALAQMGQERAAESRADALQDEIDIKNNGGLV